MIKKYNIVAFHIQKIISIGIFLFGVFIFISTAMPTSARTNPQVELFSFQNYLSSSFSMSVFPLTPQDFKLSKLGNVSISAEFVRETEHISPEVTTKNIGYCLQVPIILYHHIQALPEAKKLDQESLSVDPSYFEQHLSHLQTQGYTAITIAELDQALRNKTSLPEKSIAITIDDGYSDNYTNAYQLLQKYGMKGNFMIPTGLMDSPGYMNWTQIKEMAHNGHGIYNHTTTHAPLGYITKEKIVAEVTTANAKLEEMLGHKSMILTYPYGSYNDQAIHTLKGLGFTLALTTIHGRTQCDTNTMSLYREHIGNASLSFYGL